MSFNIKRHRNSNQIIVAYNPLSKKVSYIPFVHFQGRQVTETITEVKTYVNGQEVTTANSNPSENAIQAEPKPAAVAAADSSASSSDEEESSGGFAQEALKAHNNYRKRHGVEPLKLSSDVRFVDFFASFFCMYLALIVAFQLCNFALQWAQKLAYEDGFYHRPSNSYGENIYMSYNSNPNVTVKHYFKNQCFGKFSMKSDFRSRDPPPLRVGTQRLRITFLVWNPDRWELDISPRSFGKTRRIWGLPWPGPGLAKS